MTGIVECPFRFTGRAAIKQRIGKITIFGQEFRDRKSWFIKLKNIRMVLYHFKNRLIQADS
jgi:hypothetical protein